MDGPKLIDWGSGKLIAPTDSGASDISDDSDERIHFTATYFYLSDRYLKAYINGSRKLGGRYGPRDDYDALFYVLLHIMQKGFPTWYTTMVDGPSQSTFSPSRRLDLEDCMKVNNFYLLRQAHTSVYSPNSFNLGLVSDENRPLLEAVIKAAIAMHASGTFSIRAMIASLSQEFPEMALDRVHEMDDVEVGEARNLEAESELDG